MIQSMTGYGKATKDLPERQITVEVRSLNSKQADIILRIPTLFRSCEMELRKIVASRLVRGKIEVILTVNDLTGRTLPEVNATAVEHYLSRLRDIASRTGIRDESALVQALLRWPEILTEKDQEIDETLWQQTLETLDEALQATEAFRRREGEALEADMRGHVQTILQLLEEVTPLEAERIERVRQRLQKHLDELPNLQSADRERFEQEIAYYLDKLDINEEKVRLANHCRYFLETLEQEEYPGRKLGFIAQEMGREINTLGAKASHAGIQKLVVRMKDELEKIKEQSFNVL